MIEWFVVDRRSGQIVNCMTVQEGRPTLEGFIDKEHMDLTQHPTQAQLQNYRWYHERP